MSKVAPGQFATPPTTRSELFDADDIAGAPHRYRILGDLLGKPVGPPLQPENDDDNDVLHLMVDEEPTTFPEAEQEDCWCRVKLDELASINDSATWTLTALPVGHQAIGFKWVFKVKKDEHGAIVKHKVHLIAKGYVQREGVDFEDVFAPVARLESVRLILAVTARR